MGAGLSKVKRGVIRKERGKKSVEDVSVLVGYLVTTECFVKISIVKMTKGFLQNTKDFMYMI